MIQKKDLNSLVKDCAMEIHTVFRDNQTLEEAINNLRKHQIPEKIFYFYVVDDQNKLLGVATTRKLLLNDPQMKISEIMDRNVVCLSGNQTLREALETFETHHLLALPVVDESHRLIGAVDVQLYLAESVDIIQSKRRSDIFQMIGIYLEEGRKISAWHSYKSRMPWIFCNMFSGIVCAIISHFYKNVLGEVLILAMFIPLVLSLSESISMQSMTLSFQMLQKHRIFWILKLIFTEWKVLISLAVSCGLIVGSLSILWEGGVLSAMVIGLGILISVVISGSIGHLVPIVLHAKKWDPKLASGPIVLTLADIITTSIYLSLATWVLLT